MRIQYLFPVFFVVAIAGAGYFMTRQESPRSLVMLCGAGMKAPVLEIAKEYEKEFGVPVQLHFEGSSILRNYILNVKEGDLFLPGDKKNLDVLRKDGLVADSAFLAWHKVAILVAPGMAGKIHGLDDLARPGCRIAMSNPRQASLGRIVMEKIINVHPKGKEILHNIVVYGSSSQDVLELYRQGGIDALIEWDVMAATPEGAGLTVVPLHPPYAVKDELVLGLLTTAKYPQEAKRFYTYCLTTGKTIFARHGYDTHQ